MGLKPDQDWRPRLSVELTNEQFFRLQRALPWGMRAQVFSKLVDEICDIVETHGALAVGLLLQKGFRIVLKENEDGQSRESQG